MGLVKAQAGSLLADHDMDEVARNSPVEDRKMNYLRSLKTASFLIAFILTFPILVRAGQYKVIRVIDGDTIVVDYQGKYEKVRLLCVNTPESVHPDKKQNIPMGKVAANYAKKKLSGKYVDLEFEGSRRRGNYGRFLTYIFVDGQNFNMDLVKQGLSPYYTKYGRSRKYDHEFKDAEKSARKQKLNIWGDPALSQKYLRLESKWGQSSSAVPTVNQKKSVQTDAGIYIGNKRSHKFHRQECRWAKKMSSNNSVFFKSRQKAKKQGYVPCKVCNP